MLAARDPGIGTGATPTPVTRQMQRAIHGWHYIGATPTRPTNDLERENAGRPGATVDPIDGNPGVGARAARPGGEGRARTNVARPKCVWEVR